MVTRKCRHLLRKEALVAVLEAELFSAFVNGEWWRPVCSRTKVCTNQILTPFPLLDLKQFPCKIGVHRHSNLGRNPSGVSISIVLQRNVSSLFSMKPIPKRVSSLVFRTNSSTGNGSNSSCAYRTQHFRSTIAEVDEGGQKDDSCHSKETTAIGDG